MSSNIGLLPYSMEMSRSPGDATISTFQYRASFPSSDLPTSEADHDEYLTPKPVNRNLKRDFTAFSDLDDDLSLSQSSNPAAARFNKRRLQSARVLKFNPATYQLDSARRKIEQAIEESKTSVDLSSMNLTALPSDIADLRHIVSASQSGSFSTHLELYLTGNRLTTLPESLFEITNLAFLGLSNNRLESLSPSISKLKNLISLNIGLNQIDFFPANLLKLERLEQLVFHSSRIYCSPERQVRSSQRSSQQSSQRASQRQIHMECPPKTIFLSRTTRLNCRVPSLCEMAMRVIATHDYWSEVDEHDLATADVPPSAIHAIMNTTKCDECEGSMCDIYATREEVWSGFARTEGLPIRRNLCSRNCLDRSPAFESES